MINKKIDKNKENLKEYLFKEIDIIQKIITRMNFNSFLIKGWTITLVVVTLLLNGNKYHVFIAFIPLFVFWYLDSYYLWQEKMYKKLYYWIIENRLKTDKNLFNMNASRFKKEVRSRFEIMFSETLLWFYGSIAVLIVIYLFSLSLSLLPIIKKMVCV
ncbi:MAG: hypothetical protein KAI55_01440 [Candidatus Aenigmarchaeota archaeon]|nr:hypothetical protein [Candidatus Aenigmarchaeota archaeon]